jgi:MraZ protein
MTLFRGRAHIKIDPKGRFSLPSDFRSQMGKVRELVITNSVFRDLPFLDLMTKAEWGKFETYIHKMPSLKPEAQVIQRFYMASAEICEIDAQGRILLPIYLRDYADLTGEIAMVGMGHKIEIWSQKNWQLIFKQLQKEFTSATSAVVEGEKLRGRQ